MPRREVVFANDEVYHVYNRTIAKETIFTSLIHLRKSFEIFEYYLYPQRLSLSKFKTLPKELRTTYIEEIKQKQPLVEIYAFALMPNHFHFLIKQLQDDGIVRFFSNFQNSYAKWYNIKNDRNGSLFTNQFKGKWIGSDEVLLHSSRYIHINPVTSYLITYEQLASYPWTSFPMYVDTNNSSFVKTDLIINHFPSREKYIEFVKDQVDYQRSLAMLKHTFKTWN